MNAVWKMEDVIMSVLIKMALLNANAETGTDSLMEESALVRI